MMTTLANYLRLKERYLHWVLYTQKQQVHFVKHLKQWLTSLLNSKQAPVPSNRHYHCYFIHFTLKISLLKIIELFVDL